MEASNLDIFLLYAVHDYPGGRTAAIAHHVSFAQITCCFLLSSQEQVWDRWTDRQTGMTSDAGIGMAAYKHEAVMCLLFGCTVAMLSLSVAGNKLT